MMNLRTMICYSLPMESFCVTRHVDILQTSYLHWTGQHLIDANITQDTVVAALDIAPFAVVSHGTQNDPVFNYGNKLALNMFEMNWDEFTALPSRLSAEPMNQAERASLLARVSQLGYIDDYTGIRISKSGRRFLISNATIWNLLNDGKHYGQAALIRDWSFIE